MGIASRHSFVWHEQMTSARAGERGAEVRGGGWGGTFTYSFTPGQILITAGPCPLIHCDFIPYYNRRAI